MTRAIIATAFLLGAAAIIWMGAIFVGIDALALTITAVIGGVYLLGFIELMQFRQATATLSKALNALPEQVTDLGAWLQQLHPSLQNATQARIEGERVGLPAPVVTPYLVGLLVMLGLLGTFVGMVDTLKGAVTALEGTNELQAIRAGLAAPIQGLGLAFGTSVAGVAASAMLGLMSTLSRRERMMDTRRLDQKITGPLRSFSLVHNRQQTYQALQMQASALPDVAETLNHLSQTLESMGERLSETLTNNQQHFHQSVENRFSELANTVEKTLQASVEENSRLAADTGQRCVESIEPIVNQTLTSMSEALAAHSTQTQQQLSTTASEQLKGLSEQLQATSTQLLEQQAAGDSDRLTSFNHSLAQAQTQAQTTLTDTASNLQATLTTIAEQQQSAMITMTKDFESLSSTLGDQWRATGEQSQTQQQQLVQSWETNSQAMADTNRQQSELLLNNISDLLTNSERLIQRRIENEDQWLEQYQARMNTLTEALSADLKTLISEEQRRGEVSSERLQALEATAAQHLSQLGQELEAPMTRLIETASETPRAAAEVIAQLRTEISNNIERDNQLLEERQQVLEQLHNLSGSLQQSADDQQASIATLVTSSGGLLKEVSEQFSEQLDSKTDTLNEISAHFADSANEMASLGEAFGTAVQLFSESNTGMVDTLTHIEQSLEQSSARSDEQLGYYVAQAREIIDHSILSQKQMLEELQQLGRQENLFAETAE